MPKIHLLSDHLVSQIAAGEVVERPASVVKELVENSLDAGATEVRIELESGGKRRILVADDGVGMGRDDALLAFDRHATSKIGSFEDLQEVGTLGFRGEALASIAAVARVELVTADAPGDGQRVRIEGGRVRVAEPAARARGTTLEIANLFFNVPARRKFLKTPATELRRCVEVVQGYALARPDVRFSIHHQGRALLDAPPVPPGDPIEGARERIAQVFGRPFAEGLVAIPDSGPSETGSITGLVGSASAARGRRLFVFVNRRLLRDRSILATFYRAVRDEWRNEEYPSLFLFLDIPPEDVDVNVHPQKAEVRFRDTSILDRLYGRLREGLAAARGEEEAPLRSPNRPPAPLAWQGLGERKSPPPTISEGPWRVARAGEVTRDDPKEGSRGEVREQAPAWPAGTQQRLARPSYAPVERAVVPLSGRSGEERPFRLLGQYKGTLILLEGPDGLYLIDQHVAHERILFERLKRSMEQEETASQRLLTPPVLELSPAEHLRLTEMVPDLGACGFEVAPLSGRSAALVAMPAVLKADAAEDLLRSLLAEDEAGGSGPEVMRQRILENMAADGSCKAAVKMHHPLSAVEMEALVAELFICDNPYACPHGRPVVLEMTDADLERRFKRR